MRRTIVLLAALAFTGNALEAGEEWQLSWQELGPVVAGKKVELDLPDGHTVRGPVLAVGRDSLRLTVNKTSDPAVYPREVTSIPRSSVSTLRLIRRGSKWQVIGTVAGMIGGLLAGSVVYYYTCSDSLAYMTWGLSAGAGYGIGRAGDTKVIRIKLVDESSEAEVTP